MAKPTELPEWDKTELNSLDPGTTRKDSGWQAPGGIPEKPPFQYFNFWMNLVYKWVKELNDTGLLLWDTTTEYAADVIVRGSDGAIYRSLVAANQGNDPTSSPASWENILQAVDVLFDDTSVPFTAADVQTAIEEAALRGGATGGGTDQVFFENSLIVTTDYTLSTNKSAMSKGPITINTGVTVTIPTGYSWAII